MAGLRFFLGGKPSGGEMENRQHDRWSEPRNHYDDGRDMRQHYGRPSSPMENRFDQPDYRPMRGLYNLEPQRSDQPEPHMRGLYNYKHPDGMNHYDPQRHGGAQGNFVPLPEDDVRFHEEWNNEGGNRIGYISDVRNHDGSHSDGGHFERGVASVMESIPAVGGYAKIVESVLKVLQNPPATWAAYLKNKDYAGIAKMEAKELMSAIEKHKAPADIHKEITHTIAALMRMGM